MQRRQTQLTLGFAPDWRQQIAWNSAVPGSALTAAFPATSRNYIDVDETVEDVMDCTGEDFLFEFITRRLARLTIDFDVDPDLLAGWTAFAFGVSSSATAGTSAVQTETVTATGGTRRLRVTVGANTQITTALAWDATNATVQSALEALSNVGVGDIVVTGNPDGLIYTFGGALAERQVDMIGIDTYLLTGGTATMAMTTPGVGKTYTISRITGYTLPLMTLHVGFRGSDKQPVIFKNIVVDSLTVSTTSGEKVTASVSLIGSAVLDYATGYSMPPCMDIIPIRFGDCKAEIFGTDWIAQNMGREIEFSYQNNVVPQFDGAGIDSTRAERASSRPVNFNLYVLGEPGDQLYEWARTKQSGPVNLQFGGNNKNVRYQAIQALLKLQPTPIRFGGDPLESEIAMIARPKKVSGISATPVESVVKTSQAVAYLLPHA